MHIHIYALYHILYNIHHILILYTSYHTLHTLYMYTPYICILHIYMYIYHIILKYPAYSPPFILLHPILHRPRRHQSIDILTHQTFMHTVYTIYIHILRLVTMLILLYINYTYYSISVVIILTPHNSDPYRELAHYQDELKSVFYIHNRKEWKERVVHRGLTVFKQVSHRYVVLCVCVYLLYVYNIFICMYVCEIH